MLKLAYEVHTLAIVFLVHFALKQVLHVEAVQSKPEVQEAVHIALNRDRLFLVQADIIASSLEKSRFAKQPSQVLLKKQHTARPV